MAPEEIRQVLAAIAAGRGEAFYRIVQAYGLVLRSFVGAHIYRSDEVDDLVQETFIAAYRNLGTFRADEDLGAWLRGIARNVLRHHFRASQRRRTAMEGFRQQVAEHVSAHIEQAAAREESADIEALLHCIAQLPERLRQVVHAGLDGVKPTALAEQMATSVGAVYNLHYRANQLLRDCVQKERD